MQTPEQLQPITPASECTDALKRAIYQAQYALHCGQAAGHTSAWQTQLHQAIDTAKAALWHLREQQP